MCGILAFVQRRKNGYPILNFALLRDLEMGLSERHSHRKLQLPRRIRSCRSHEISWHLVISWKVLDSNVLSAIVEARRVTHDAVISELKATVQPIEKVERSQGVPRPARPVHRQSRGRTCSRAGSKPRVSFDGAAKTFRPDRRWMPRSRKRRSSPAAGSAG